MTQGTTPKENWAMVWGEVKKFPHGRIFHKLLNVLVERSRIYPKTTVFLVFGLGFAAGVVVRGWF